MDDIELDRRMRDADPAVTRVIAPLTLRATADLEAITSGNFIPRAARAARRRAHGRRLAALSIATVLLVATVVAVQTVGPAGRIPQTAAAATPPMLEPSGRILPISVALDSSIARLGWTRTLPLHPLRRSVHEAWFSTVEFGADAAVAATLSPEEVTFLWEPDGSGTERSVAGSSWNQDSKEFKNGETVPAPGTVLRDRYFHDGFAGIDFPDVPSTSPETMRLALVHAGWSNPSDPSQLVSAIENLLNEWTLTAAQQSALVRVVRKATGFVSLGTVTDRLGRSGLAFRAPSLATPSFESVLVLSATTGAVIATEWVYTGGDPDLDAAITAPAVLSYYAWK